MLPAIKRTVHVLKEQIFISSILANSTIKMSTDYEQAVNCINSLQSNFTYKENAAKQGIVPHSAIYSTTIAETQKYLLRTGVTLDQLDKLSVIHVAGTKGKGSTCAFCESILRQYGYKTGFFSSPHLVAVRERIKLNGIPLGRELFARNVFRIFNTLMDQREHDSDMPAYFRFLTILAFNIFLAEKVDVAVIEVGIGGEYDCTNVLRKTPIAGITSLGIDHISMLGNTIEQIAWQKAGIMKKDAQVFTVPQPDTAMNVLKERSIERQKPINQPCITKTRVAIVISNFVQAYKLSCTKLIYIIKHIPQCTLEIVPNFNDYNWNNKIPTLGINGDIQKINASLAIKLAHSWIHNCGQRHRNDLAINRLEVPDLTKIGLENCKWPGRNQIFKTATANFYLDGAHTTDSIHICTEWFKSVSTHNKKALIFNATGDRNSEELLEQLSFLNLNYIFFVPNIASSQGFADQTNLSNTTDKQIERCMEHKAIWLKLNNSNTKDQIFIYPSVADALESLPKNEVTDILVTGSLHLVGAALSLLDPDLKTF